MDRQHPFRPDESAGLTQLQLSKGKPAVVLAIAGMGRMSPADRSPQSMASARYVRIRLLAMPPESLRGYFRDRRLLAL